MDACTCLHVNVYVNMYACECKLYRTRISIYLLGGKKGNKKRFNGILVGNGDLFGTFECVSLGG